MKKNIIKNASRVFILALAGALIITGILIRPENDSKIKNQTSISKVDKNSETFKKCVEKCQSDCFWSQLPLCDCAGTYCEEEILGKRHF